MSKFDAAVSIAKSRKFFAKFTIFCARSFQLHNCAVEFQCLVLKLRLKALCFGLKICFFLKLRLQSAFHVGQSLFQIFLKARSSRRYKSPKPEICTNFFWVALHSRHKLINQDASNFSRKKIFVKIWFIFISYGLV